MDLAAHRSRRLTVRILVVNAGSSSVKLRLLDDHDDDEPTTVLEGTDLSAGVAGLDVDALAEIVRQWGRPDAVGHRVVHGGNRFTGPVRVDPAVRQELDQLTDLAPLHQPKSLAALDATTALLPDTVAVACFDTAFHTTIPAAAATYAVPLDWRRRWNIRRYGFHGLSHKYASGRAAQMLDRSPEGLRVVTCHLGAGASLAAVVGGRSVDTTMGFTPLDGLVMATRSGSVDPGLVLWLEEHEHLAPSEIADALEHRSGLTALAGTGDMRAIDVAAARGDPDAHLAIDVYVHRLAAGVAAMCAATGGLDALVFTGGVGENSPTVRRRAGERLGFLGVAIDPEVNSGGTDDVRGDDRDVSAADAGVRTVVIRAREDLEIAAGVRSLLAGETTRAAPRTGPLSPRSLFGPVP